MFDLLEDRMAPAVFSGFGAVRVDLDQNGHDRFVANVLPANDDGSTGQISLVNSAGFSAPINFFGPSYSSLYVNNNGNLTFNGPLSTFTPFGLTGHTNIPIIAPFFADVWTLGGSGLTKYGFGTVGGHHGFGATWDHVNYYADSTSNGTNPGSKQNYFQVLLIERSDTGTGNFDIEFNYDQIQWETGSASGGSGGLGGTSAHAGYSNGSGTANTFFELPGSGDNGALLDSNIDGVSLNGNIIKGLIHGSAGSNVFGRYDFSVRSGFVIPTISVVDLGGVYNGSAYAATASLSGLSGVTPTLTYYRGETELPGAPKDVGTYTVVASIAGTSTYAAASNSTIFSITPKALTVSGITADDKTYDGTTIATLNFRSASLAGVVGSDAVSLDSVTGTFASKDVGIHTVTVPTVSLSGAQAGNYILTQPTGLTASITPATPTVTVRVASGLYNELPFEATATVAGIDGAPRSTLEDTSVSITYFEGTSTDGEPLAGPPTDPGVYTAVAKFKGSDNYKKAQDSASFLIVPKPPVDISTTESVGIKKTIAPNEKGLINIGDTASVEVTPASGGGPIDVSLESFYSTESRSTRPAIDGGTIDETSDGPVRVFAKFDLKVLGASPGTVIVARFRLPPFVDRIPLALYYDTDPKDDIRSKPVPIEMYYFDFENGYLVVTFTDSSPVTFYALFGTVFTITEAANFVFPLFALIAPPNQDNLANSNDILGDLLDSQGTAGDGQLIGAVAPTNVSQISAPSAGRSNPNADEAERARHWLRILDAIYFQLQRILDLQLHLLADKLMVTEPTVFSDAPPNTQEALDRATPQEPIFSHDNSNTIEAAPSSCVILAAAEESVVAIPSAEIHLRWTPGFVAPPSSTDRRWQCLAVAAGLLWPDLVLGNDVVADSREEKSRQRLRNRLSGGRSSPD